MKIQLTRKRIVILAGLLGLAWAGFFVEIYKDVGEHCDFTGSKRGWREYPLGIRRSEFYEASPLEIFIKENHPSELEHSWVSYRGTARIWYGLGIRRGHGSPNSLLATPKQSLESFVQDSPPQEVKDFYDFLRTNKLAENEVDAEIDKKILTFVHPVASPL